MNRTKQSNLSAVLQILLQTGPTSRVQLAAQTTLSNTSITNLTSELLELGLIAENGETDLESNAGQRSVGRPRRMLNLVPDARYVVGVHIGIGIFRVAIANLRANLINSQILEFDPASPASDVVDKISKCIQGVMDESDVDITRVLGVGVGLSGLVNHRAGVNVFAPRLNWRDVSVKSILENKLGLPVCVDNNVRAMALGEALFGAGKNVDTLAFVYGRVGVGAGFVVNGRVFRGSGAGAGEIGHSIFLLPNQGPELQESAHQFTSLETLVSEWSILQEVEAIAKKQPDSVIAAQLFIEDTTQTPIERVFAAARAGDQITMNILEQRAQYLGIALANLTNTLNPELIILGGMFAQGADLFLPMAETTLKRLAFAQLGENVQIKPTSFGWRAGIIGASALALSNYVYQPSI